MSIVTSESLRAAFEALVGKIPDGAHAWDSVTVENIHEVCVGDRVGMAEVVILAVGTTTRRQVGTLAGSGTSTPRLIYRSYFLKSATTVEVIERSLASVDEIPKAFSSVTAAVFSQLKRGDYVGSYETVLAVTSTVVTTLYTNGTSLSVKRYTLSNGAVTVATTQMTPSSVTSGLQTAVTSLGTRVTDLESAKARTWKASEITPSTLGNVRTGDFFSEATQPIVLVGTDSLCYYKPPYNTAAGEIVTVGVVSSGTAERYREELATHGDLGDNLLFGASEELNSTAYGLGYYPYDKPLTVGRQYTLTMKATVAADDDEIRVYSDGGSVRVAQFMKADSGKVKSFTFTASGDLTCMTFFHYPNDTTLGAGTKVEWAVLTEGSHAASEWRPSAGERMVVRHTLSKTAITAHDFKKVKPGDFVRFSTRQSYGHVVSKGDATMVWYNRDAHQYESYTRDGSSLGLTGTVAMATAEYADGHRPKRWVELDHYTRVTVMAAGNPNGHAVTVDNSTVKVMWEALRWDKDSLVTEGTATALTYFPYEDLLAGIILCDRTNHHVLYAPLMRVDSVNEAQYQVEAVFGPLLLDNKLWIVKISSALSAAVGGSGLSSLGVWPMS